MEHEQRLIDANALDIVANEDGIANGIWIGGRHSEQIMGMVLSVLKKMIDDAPTVDAVPVDEILLHYILIDERGIPEVKLQLGTRILVLRREGDPVNVMEVAGMKEFAEDVVYQFGYYCQNDGRLHITHGGLSSLERAFDILGWENPHPVPECECEIEGCHEHATCGTPTPDGYKRMCGRHFQINCANMKGE